MRARLKCIPRCLCLVALIFCACLTYGQAAKSPQKDHGVIEGTVINEKGQPVPHAQAFTLPNGPTIAAIRFVETDNNGHFRLDRMDWGTYHVFAKKISAGYPDIAFNFYAAHAVQATLSPSSPVAEVVVHVGPPCGILKITSVIDAVTAEPIKDYGVTLRWASDAHRIMGGSFSGPILIPPNVDVLVEVSAKGYESWPTEEEGKESGRIHLASGQVLNLQVRLHRSTTSGTK